MPEVRVGDGHYHPVPLAVKMIDGVFIPLRWSQVRWLSIRPGTRSAWFPRKTRQPNLGFDLRRAASRLQPNGHENEYLVLGVCHGPGPAVHAPQFGITGYLCQCGNHVRSRSDANCPIRACGRPAFRPPPPWPIPASGLRGRAPIGGRLGLGRRPVKTEPNPSPSGRWHDQRGR